MLKLQNQTLRKVYLRLISAVFVDQPIYATLIQPVGVVKIVEPSSRTNSNIPLSTSSILNLLLSGFLLLYLPGYAVAISLLFSAYMVCPLGRANETVSSSCRIILNFLLRSSVFVSELLAATPTLQSLFIKFGEASFCEKDCFFPLYKVSLLSTVEISNHSKSVSTSVILNLL